MEVKFWGTRGSIPTPLSAEVIQQKIRYALEGAAGLDLEDPTALERYVDRLPLNIRGTIGGNTTCVEIRDGDQLLIIDAGSGLRLLGGELMVQGFAAGDKRADFLISHSHWDHIQGFPFFGPAFIRNNHFAFHSPFPDLADRLSHQQDEVFFPVPVTYMSATLEFKQIAPDTWHQIGRFRVLPMRLSHPGPTYAYRVETDDASLVFASDGEYKRLARADTERFVQFFKDADLLIFDAQYSLSESLDKYDWGHSSAVMGAELAHRACVKRLALFHHDPTSSDEKVLLAQEEAEAYLQSARRNDCKCRVLVAYEGLSLSLS